MNASYCINIYYTYTLRACPHIQQNAYNNKNALIMCDVPHINQFTHTNHTKNIIKITTTTNRG